MAPRNRRTDGDRNHAETGTSEPFENFHAGYLRIDEDHLYRTGIRGPKKYVLYCTVAFIFVITMANLFVTVAIIGSLQITYKGAAAFEFIPEAVFWRVFYDVDAKSVVFSEKGKLGGRSGKDLYVNSYDSSPNATVITADTFTVVDPGTGRTMFSSDSLPAEALKRKYNTIKADRLFTGKLSSRVDESLRLEADRYIYMTGMEGVEIRGSKVAMTASEIIGFSVADGSVVVNGSSGATISENIATFPPSTNSVTLKLCVCAGSGRIFLSSPATGCYHTGPENPCSL